jgi:hypothetical protein
VPNLQIKWVCPHSQNRILAGKAGKFMTPGKGTEQLRKPKQVNKKSNDKLQGNPSTQNISITHFNIQFIDPLI